MSEQSDSNTEQRIMLAMRKVLAAIVRETTPNPGMKHVLSENTREDIRMCFTLISARERELAEHAGAELNMRPRYSDQPPASSTVVPINQLRKSSSKDQDENN